MTERVVILDAGAQYGKVIDRRVRELSVECDLLPLDTPPDQLTQYAAMIISGWATVGRYDADAPRYDPAIFSLGVPVLGICYGMQLLCCAHGGSVARKARREDGQFEVEVEADCALFEGVSSRTPVLLTHGDSLNELPAGGRVVARSGDIVAAIEFAERKHYGVQFHPEVDLSKEGTHMLRNFLYRVCGLSGSYSMASREELAIECASSRSPSREEGFAPPPPSSRPPPRRPCASRAGTSARASGRSACCASFRAASTQACVRRSSTKPSAASA